ncbi:MAG: MBL fold metallo-hydrolase [Bryobacterales bacterium]|nr:MBL fold metallo-hydrolase [Bryobacterales bacterium]
MSVESTGEGSILSVTILASGSTGNATLVSTNRARVLFDAGISRRELYRRLAEVSVDPAEISAVVLSHEHSDHISGLLSLLKHQQSHRRAPLPLFCNARTLGTLDWKGFVPTVELVEAGARFPVADLEIGTFTIPHDAADPMGFVIQAEGQRLGLLTDLGYVPDSIRFHLAGANFLLLESNHDLEMLKVGPYPWSVKQRVMGRNGHLSNDVAASFAAGSLSSELHTLVLGHLSGNNNHPAIARLAMENALNGASLHPRLEVAEREGPVLRFDL